MPLANPHPTGAYTRKRHRERMERPYPKIEDDPELSAAYHSLQLHWLQTMPGYREALKQKLSEAAIEAERTAKRVESTQRTLDGQKLSQVLAVEKRAEQLERLTGY